MPNYPDQIEILPLAAPFDVTLSPPGSKSLTHRAFLLAAIAEGTSNIHGPLLADDTRLTLDALDALGFKTLHDPTTNTANITGTAGHIPAPSANLDLGLAGTAMRLLTGFVALGRGPYTLDGVPRMRERPMAELIDPLQKLGVEISCPQNQGFPPVRIDQGFATPIKQSASEILMRPTLSSQFISALLLIAPYLPNGLTLRFDGPVTSKPYVQLTLGIMNRFGVETSRDPDMTRIDIAPGVYRAQDYHVEPDASSATYLLAAAAAIPDATCTIENLGTSSLQGDAQFAYVLEKMGANVRITDTQTTVTGGPKLRGIDIDLNAMPDAAMTPAALAILADSPSVIRNVGNWRVKETDRMAAMHNELNKLGATATINGDDLHITPPQNGKITPAKIETYDDHRVAMSFAIVGLAKHGVTILDPACVTKSYPTFFDDIAKLRGASPISSS